MTNAMTKPCDLARRAVEQLARERLRLNSELRPPVLKRLAGKPVNLTILSLVQVALPPRLVVRAPKGLRRDARENHSPCAICSSSLCKQASENRSRLAGS